MPSILWTTIALVILILLDFLIHEKYNFDYILFDIIHMVHKNVKEA